MAIGSVNPALSQLNKTNNSISKITQKITTGSNYPDASYGGAAYAILQRMNSHISATNQSVQNTQNMSSMVRTAQGATSNTIDALKTIQETLVNAANGTNTSTDRAAMQENINQLVAQIDDNAGVQYNGMNLLDGSKENLLVSGVNGYENVSLGDMRSQALGLRNENGNVSIDLSSDESIQAALEAVGGALDFVQGVDGDLQASLEGGLTLDEALDEATSQGAYAQRLQYQSDLYTTMSENEQAAASTIGDADIAKEITNLKSEQVLQQIGLYAAQMYNHNLSNALALLS